MDGRVPSPIKVWLSLPSIGGFVKVSWSLVHSELPTSRPVGARGFIINKGLFRIFHAVLSVASEKDQLPSSVGLDSRARSDDGFFGVSVTKLTTGRLVMGSSCGGSDMVIKNLDLEPKIDAMMRDFLDPSRWKELRKETSSKILPCGDGSCWKTLKPVASLIA
ncbi:hypothetical protein Tco_0136677, partial [Tanacetum coccineum]